MKHSINLDLLERAKAGEEEAIQELYGRFRPKLLRLCKGYEPIWDGKRGSYVDNDPPHNEAMRAAQAGFWKAIQDYKGNGLFHKMVEWRVKTALEQLCGEHEAWKSLKSLLHLVEWEDLSGSGCRSVRAVSAYEWTEEGQEAYATTGDARDSTVAPIASEFAGMPTQPNNAEDDSEDDPDKSRSGIGRGPLMRPIGHQGPKGPAGKLRWRYRDAMLREAMRATRLDEKERSIWEIELKVADRRWRTQQDAAEEVHGHKKYQYRVARDLERIRARLAAALMELGFDPEDELTDEEARQMEGLMPIFVRPITQTQPWGLGGAPRTVLYIDDRNLGPGPIYVDRPELHKYGDLDQMQQVDRDVISAWRQAKGA